MSEIFTNLKIRFEHIELPAKLLDNFLRSNKSNINQSIVTNVAFQVSFLFLGDAAFFRKRFF